jgi:hypothetical protein
VNHISFGGLLAVAVIALLAPLLVSAVPRARIPADVVAIVAGIVVGPSVLGWVEIDTPITVLSLLGLAFLLFLAGLELDLDRLRGPLLRLAVAGFALTVGIGVVAGLAFHAAGYVISPFLLAVALPATVRRGRSGTWASSRRVSTGGRARRGPRSRPASTRPTTSRCSPPAPRRGSRPSAGSSRSPPKAGGTTAGRGRI